MFKTITGCRQNGMRGTCVRITIALLLLTGFSAAQSAVVQEKCLQPGKLVEIRNKLAGSEESPRNGPLGEEILQAATRLTNLARAAKAETAAGKTAQAELDTFSKAWAGRVCTILNTNGWPRKAAVGRDGSERFLFIIHQTLSRTQQLEVYPVIADAFQQMELEGSEVLASFVDRLRLAIGRKQLYGSQAYVRDGFLVMAPIENIAGVDKRRAAFGLTSLRAYERDLEIEFRQPLIRMVSEAPLPTIQQNRAAENAVSKLGDLVDEIPVINVETAFVSLDVIVPEAAASGSASLEKSDFQLFDSGKKIEIETFARAEAPFDIVLLLDLSGSTSDKVGLIRKSTRRFVEMKRANDRVAVVAFHDTQLIVSELEADKAVLLERIKKIEGRGGSNIWGSIKFGLDMLDQESAGGRRKAIVLMSDGADNQLAFFRTLTRHLSFADLVEAVQRSNAAIFPIYLDTEDRNDLGSRRVYSQARQTLSYLAEQSAGNMYSAKKLDDVAEIYDRVLKDVGTVYTLGFTPDVESGSPQWRELRVEIPSRPNLKLKHRPGYLTR